MKIKALQSPSDTFDLQMPGNKPFDVVGFGLNSVDYVCVLPEYPRQDSKTEILQYERLAGGQTATALAFLARMGVHTKYIGKVGSDDAGRVSLQSFEGESIDISSVLVEQDARNPFSVILLDQKSGERTVLCRRDKELNFRESELKEDDVCSGRILHLDGYDTLALNTAVRCQRKGIPVCADLDTAVPHCRSLLENVDFLIASSNFPSDFTGIHDPEAAFKALRRCFGGFLAITLGARGAAAWVGNQCMHFAGISVKPVDTTGAGDIFHGAFVFGVLQNWPLDKIMGFANTAAGLSCLYLGARNGIRPLPEILQYMTQQHTGSSYNVLNDFQG
jgi:sugar/nucleoside kinase (ribokinase family)